GGPRNRNHPVHDGKSQEQLHSGGLRDAIWVAREPALRVISADEGGAALVERADRIALGRKQVFVHRGIGATKPGPDAIAEACEKFLAFGFAQLRMQSQEEVLLLP